MTEPIKGIDANLAANMDIETPGTPLTKEALERAMKAIPRYTHNHTYYGWVWDAETRRWRIGMFQSGEDAE